MTRDRPDRPDSADSLPAGARPDGTSETEASGAVVAPETVPDDPVPGDPVPGGTAREGAPPDAAAPPDDAWGLPRLLGFRFLVAYLLLFTFPFPFSFVPVVGQFADAAVRHGWTMIAPWVGTHVLGLEGEMYLGPTGSGDTTFNYVQVLVMVVVALGATGGWSLLDRRRRHHRGLARWVTVGVSFYLGMVMISYGLAKVIPTQFTTPSLRRLLTPYGDSSPMGIVWTFMGLVPAYTVFAGLGELVGGLLVLLRRTRTLGAAILTAVMTNVVMLNFCFDVPVKLFSSHLLAMAVGLLLLDGRRLFGVLLTPTPMERPPLLARRWMRITAVVLALLLVGSFMVRGIVTRVANYNVYGAGRAVSSLYGIYEVDRFVLDGEEHPPLLTDEERWRRLVVDRALPLEVGDFRSPGRITVQGMDGGFDNHWVELDEESRVIHLIGNEHQSLEEARQAGEDIDTLVWERPEPERLVLRGTWEGQELLVEATWRDPKSFELVGRGFRWINEQPYNR